LSFVHTKKLTIGDYLIGGALGIYSLACVLPFIYMVTVSFTDPSVYVPLKFYLIPEKWSMDAYKYILANNRFIEAFNNTVFITLVGCVLSLVVTFTMAYALTRKLLPGRGFILGAVVFTLLFHVGIIPNYLVVKGVGLLDSLWALIWPALTNAWSVIVVKSFLDSLPSELEDAASIDGCNDMGIFTRVIIPLSMPAIAAFALIFAVSQWNVYFNALIYISDANKWTLQLLVKTMVMDAGSNNVDASSDAMQLPQETIRMAAILLSMAPILVIYPFLQKYFAQGVMIGSVKG
jgi:putative aldouronate transport system permease protein